MEPWLAVILRPTRERFVGLLAIRWVLRAIFLVGHAVTSRGSKDVGLRSAGLSRSQSGSVSQVAPLSALEKQQSSQARHP
jgi:hypothetical protein